jgi:hypothetical protein
VSILIWVTDEAADTRRLTPIWTEGSCFARVISLDAIRYNPAEGGANAVQGAAFGVGVDVDAVNGQAEHRRLLLENSAA